MAENKSSIEKKIFDLVHIRASQMNGCGFCLDKHMKEAKIHVERNFVYTISSWRESSLFDLRERAALAWTEILTKLSEHGVSDELYENVRGQFTEKEISNLTFSIMAINAWNHINVAFKTEPGSADAAYGLNNSCLS